MQKSLMYLKSSISISSYSGCTINCKYCILSTYRENNHIEKIIDEDVLCNNLLKSKFFVKDFTSISVNNISDPFLNTTLKKSTFKILDILEKHQLQNPILLITKSYLNNEDIDFINSKKLNIYILYTFSGLSEKYENRNLNLQFKTMELLKKTNKKTICYWRPVIEGINSSKEIVDYVASNACKYFENFVISGVRINSHLLKVFFDNNIPINIKPDAEHKVINDETYDLIYSTIKNYNKNANVFRKTSCAIAYLNGKADYNNNFSNEKLMCKQCLNFENCNKKEIKDINFLKKLFEKIDCYSEFNIKNNVIEYDGVLTQEEISFVSQNSGYKVKPVLTIKSNSEEILSK